MEEILPPKTECSCLSGGGIKNGHIRYPGGTQKERKKKEEICGCMDSVLSRMTSRIVTWSEKGMSVLSSWRAREYNYE